MLIHGPLKGSEHRQLEAGRSRHRLAAGAVSHFACIIFNFGLRACCASRGRTGAYLVSSFLPRSTRAWVGLSSASNGLCANRSGIISGARNSLIGWMLSWLSFSPV